MAPHSSTLAWKIPWMEEPGGLQSMGLLESDTTKQLNFHFSLSCIGEGNGNPLQCSCLENPRDRGAWWAAVYGVTQSWTRLKWLSSLAALNWCSDGQTKAVTASLRRKSRKRKTLSSGASDDSVTMDSPTGVLSIICQIWETKWQILCFFWKKKKIREKTCLY